MRSLNGPKLKKMREKVELTQNDVAKSLGHSTPQLVSNWERGMCALPTTSILPVAKIYKVKPAVLLAMATKDFEARVLKRIAGASKRRAAKKPATKKRSPKKRAH